MNTLKEFFELITNSPLGVEITKFMVAWFFVRRTVKGSFDDINVSLKGIRGEIGGLKNELLKLEGDHSGRLNNLENEIKDLKKAISEWTK